MSRHAVQDEITTATSNASPWKGRSLLSQFQFSTCFGTHQTASNAVKRLQFFPNPGKRNSAFCLHLNVHMGYSCSHFLRSFKAGIPTGARLHTANESSWRMGQRRVEGTVQNSEEGSEEYGWWPGVVDAVHCLQLLRLGITPGPLLPKA